MIAADSDEAQRTRRLFDGAFDDSVRLAL